MGETMPGRSKIRGHYVTRDKMGRFKRWISIGKSIAADRRKKVGSSRIPRDANGGLMSGFGDLGDYPERKKKEKNIFKM